MRCRMMKPHKLKVNCYADHLIDFNDYLAAFPGVKGADNIVETDLNEILLNSMPNVWSKQAYVQCFDCETIT